MFDFDMFSQFIVSGALLAESSIDFSLPFTLQALFTLGMLILLQAVLGFDNLLYISLESKRVAEDKQSYVRKMGIGLAIALRIVLLVVVLLAIDNVKTPLFEFGLQPSEHVAASGGHDAVPISDQGAPKGHSVRQPNEHGSWFAGAFNIHSIIVLLGGVFIIYTAFKEIMHMLAIDHLESHLEEKKPRSVGAAIFWIVLMNLVFSFDSILSAIALTHNVWIMSLAVIVSGVLMIVLADRVAEFLKKNRMYEVLGLFILFIVGVMLVSEGGHLAHLHLFGYVIEPMAKSTFYFVIAILVVVDIIQSQYQKKLLAQSAAEGAG
jgi:predicted tellurium resistance membrane protein TerC